MLGFGLLLLVVGVVASACGFFGAADAIADGDAKLVLLGAGLLTSGTVLVAASEILAALQLTRDTLARRMVVGGPREGEEEVPEPSASGRIRRPGFHREAA